jgi:tagaturonate reductase
MILSRYNLKNIGAQDVVTPAESVFDLPEKVLQFGTGVLLRGLPDYFIDKANRQGVFNGRVVVVKSTDSDSTAFDKQDGLYTLCVRGLDGGQKVEENIINSAISRVLSAKDEWSEILQCAHNPHMQIIISNTTEVGIQLVQDDIHRLPPVSFPGKLLAFLLERYKAFDGSRQSGMVIVPTELIPDNGKKLESIVLELAHLLKPYPANFSIVAKIFSALAGAILCCFAPSTNCWRLASISSGFFLPIARRNSSACAIEKPASALAAAITCSW